MNLVKHKNILLRSLGEDAVKLLKTTNAIIAGGAITSIFTGAEINDYDIYFRSKKDIVTFIRNTFNEEGEEGEPFILSEEDFLDVGSFEFVCLNQTSRSITYSHNGLNLQLIHFDYFETAHDIFESYDFHINMAAYDFKIDDFVLHDYFITAVAARRLTFNAGTRYPIMSSLRVSKYLERGYNISKKEMFKIGIATANLNIDSWDALEDQLSGFYGIDVSNMFDRSKPFSIELAIEMIDEVQDMITPQRPNSPTIDQLLFNIVGNPFKEQRLFFKRITLDKDGTYYNFIDRDERYTLNESTAVKNSLFDTDHEELLSKPSYFWGYGSNTSVLGIFLLEEEGHKMTMGYSGLELTGNVKLIAVRENN
ncbi:hypothetical protein GAP32_076 [Cronobacter phage vB_CsaM_GAP32]|uniref:Uncharacterized protein n=1 Tax=Cronobacter phage vB_CsaM_GAP32 TaxID=1141136 RepID=K4FB09_9CAUD|nr:hypothetical protein GAP32_076 [Cronobacter phage vB_CsaM_GAP32]AFC21524.1 hypothetical protein GAP32_076 [Cronobacter phage vB_CsaM_GAP32]